MKTCRVDICEELGLTSLMLMLYLFYVFMIVFHQRRIEGNEGHEI